MTNQQRRLSPVLVYYEQYALNISTGRNKLLVLDGENDAHQTNSHYSLVARLLFFF